MILYNDLEPTEKLKVYDTGYHISTDEEKKRIMIDYRTGDINVPKLHTNEALLNMANDFISCILSNKIPRSNAQIGLNVVRVLEASSNSISSNGARIMIENKVATHQGSGQNIQVII